MHKTGNKALVFFMSAAMAASAFSAACPLAAEELGSSARSEAELLMDGQELISSGEETGFLPSAELLPADNAAAGMKCARIG